MRILVSLLGWSLDLSLEPTADEGGDEGAALDGGTLTATETIAVARPEQPDFVGFGDRNNGWGDEGNRLGR